MCLHVFTLINLSYEILFSYSFFFLSSLTYHLVLSRKKMNIWRIIIFILYSLVACFYKVFVPNNPRRSIQKIDYSIKNTTRIMIPYRRPTTMPQIRLDWLEKFGLIKRTSTSTTTHFFKHRF
jgi:hypothetical protein